ncbi:Ig-like domain-containing protein [Marinifilum sp.]|uniref:Ig-like domain-containing protein n=1 Tax=Marinifilum sp. TaxID=2033137 RepID=UPI003BA9929D
MKTLHIKITSALMLLLTLFLFSCDDDENDDMDIVNPYVVSYNPVMGVDGVALSSNLVLTFDDIVNKGSGNITITTDVEQGTQVIDVNSDAVTISNVGRVMTINPQDFLSGRDYQVVIDKGIVVDMAGNEYFGMPDEEQWVFKTGGNTGDLDAPLLAGLTPSKGSTDASVIAIHATFNEDVKTSTGNFIIYNSSDVAVATIDAEGEAISIDGARISINFPEPLDFGTAYYVNFDQGVVKDIAGNSFAGITDKSTWSFTTTAGSGSDLVVHLPFDSDMKDISGNAFHAMLGATATADVSFVNDATRGDVIQFNAGSFASLPKHDLLRPGATQDFSFNFWVKLAGTDSDPAIFSNKNWDGGSNQGFVLCTDDGHEYVPGDDNDGWSVNVSDGNRVDWEAGDCTPNNAPSMSDDEWHMISVSFDRANGKLSVYIDGVAYSHPEGADISGLTGAFYDEVNDYPFNIWEDGTGMYNASDDRRAAMTGLMDDLRVYNKVLSQDDITELFNN